MTPTELRAKVMDLVSDFFHGDTIKVGLWFTTPNPLLGGQAPARMIDSGCGRKVLAFALNAHKEGSPADGRWRTWLSEECRDEVEVGGSWCPQCGPHVAVDDDGCCQTCGATALGEGTREAHRARIQARRLRRQPNDLVRLAMERAAAAFGGSDGTFTAANFSVAMMKLAGLEGAMDGKLVRAVLTGRRDVDTIDATHYRLAVRLLAG